MSIKSIRIKNLLSYDELIINDFKDINCIVGRNNTGKSNLLKLIRFFYNKLDGKRELPPELNSTYSRFGTITIIYDTARIEKIVTSEKNRNKSLFFKHIYNTLFKEEFHIGTAYKVIDDINKNTTYELTLKIGSDNSTQWSTNNKNILNIINYLYPFFDIETRHMELYNWDKLWMIVSRLKSFNVENIEPSDIVNFFDEKLSKETGNYKEYITKIENIVKVEKYNYREQVLNYVKAGLTGHTFLINNQSLDIQSDGTNSHRFIEIAFELLISLSRRDYINPTIYIDEPEIGLHPKKNEKLIYDLFNVYTTYKKTRKEKEEGKYNTPYPKIIFSTHSPNIVKEVIRLFDTDQQILHFSKNNKENTAVQKMNSIYDNKRFLNIFSDNEARLFFSDFILFVEGATEQEVFSNRALVEKFKIMQDIDVYATNELVLKYINPSYANTSIPYLVLYDADKLITIDIDNKKLDFNKFTINIVSYFNLYKKSYIGSKQKFLYNLLKQLLEWKKSIILEFDSNLYIKNINYSLFIKYVNDVFLAQENYILNKTTIEEVLINNDSFYLFKRWLIYEYQTNIYKSMNNKIPAIEKNKIIIAKTKNMKNFKKFINTKFATKREVTTAFILVFSGKTETSITTSTKNYNKIDSNFIENINKIKETYLSNSLNLGYLLGKTSGWVTSFLNFSINKIENNIEKKQFENQIDKDKEFRIEFKKYFGELYDTISIIENKY